MLGRSKKGIERRFGQRVPFLFCWSTGFGLLAAKPRKIPARFLAILSELGLEFEASFFQFVDFDFVGGFALLKDCAGSQGLAKLFGEASGAIGVGLFRSCLLRQLFSRGFDLSLDWFLMRCFLFRCLDLLCSGRVGIGWFESVVKHLRNGFSGAEFSFPDRGREYFLGIAAVLFPPVDDVPHGGGRRVSHVLFALLVGKYAGLNQVTEGFVSRSRNGCGGGVGVDATATQLGLCA